MSTKLKQRTRTSRTQAGASRGGHRTLAGVGVVVLLVVGGVCAPAPLAAAHSPARGRDLVTVAGYDFDTDDSADVAAQSGGHNLVVDVRMASPLVDGTVALTIPRQTSPTNLHPGGWLTRDDPDLSGSVVVRPLQPGEIAPTVPGGGPGTVPAWPGPTCVALDQVATVSTENTASRHTAVLQRVSCLAGQDLQLKLVGLEAPRRPGRYPVMVLVTDAEGHRTRSRAWLQVVAPVTTGLSIEASPQTGTLGHPMTITVHAVRQDGGLTRAVPGPLRLVVLGSDCPPDPSEAPQFELTEADHGTKVLTFTPSNLGSTRLSVESIQRRALPATTATFDVTGDPSLESTCTGSRSYH